MQDLTLLAYFTSLVCILHANVIERQVENAVFAQGQVLGKVTAQKLDEASGLAASRKHPGYLYSHNDHGDGPHIFVLSALDGQLVATLTVSGVTSHDWEDVAVGPCSKFDNTTCLYIADTGDAGHGALDIVYKVVEPDSLTSQILPAKENLTFTWDQADCETLLVDPTGEVIIISKVESGVGTIAQLPSSAWGTGTPVHLSSTAIVGIVTSSKDPVGGDISPDGEEVLIKARHAVYYWWMNGSRDYVSVLQNPGTKLTYRDEHRGEAVCWDTLGDGYFTLGEGAHQPLYYYSRNGR